MDVFRPKGNGRPSLLRRPRPHGNQDYLCFGPDTDGFEAYIDCRVLEFVRQETATAAPNETIGLLAGRSCEDDQGPYTLVLEAEGAHRDEEETGPGHVRISSAGMAQLRRRLEIAHPALENVGWYHSHPSYPPEFSTEDKLEQKTHSQNNIGLVVSGLPQGESFGLYRGPAATKLPHRERVTTSRLVIRADPPFKPKNSPLPGYDSGTVFRPKNQPAQSSGSSGRSSILSRSLLPWLVISVVVLAGIVGWSQVQIWRLKRQPFDISFTCTPKSTVQQLTIQCEAQGPEDVTTWIWGFGDNNTTGIGTIESGQTVNHIYTQEGTYNITLIALTSHGSVIQVKPVQVNS